MRKFILGAVAAAAMGFAGAASASINVSVWTDQTADASDPSLANIAALGAANATTTVGDINFTTNDSTATTINQWLGTSLADPTGSHELNNSVFLFTGTMFLNAGVNSFSILHDDGIDLNITGIGDFPDTNPTSATQSPFNVVAPSAGLYNFQLGYGECCGGPATVDFAVNGAPVGGVPEPATWALMFLGVGALGGFLRLSRRETIAAAV